MNTTFMFKEIISSYTDFEEVLTDISTNFGVVIDPVFALKAYTMISRRFNNYSVRYDVPEAFVSALVLVLLDKYEKYQREVELINKVIKLTDEELKVMSDVVNNVAENPNNAPTDPLQALSYVSTQHFTQGRSGKVQAYLNALDNVPSMQVFDFLIKRSSQYSMSFQDLFSQVVVENKPIYEKGRYY